MRGVLIFIIALPIFIFLDNGVSLPAKERFIQELIFAFALSLTFNKEFKRYILIFSISSLMIMVLLVSFLKFAPADWFGSLGFGALLIYFIGLLPQLIRRGHVDKDL